MTRDGGGYDDPAGLLDYTAVPLVLIKRKQIILSYRKRNKVHHGHIMVVF